MNKNNLLIAGGAIAFLVFAGLAWNYAEVAKERNAIERERVANEEMARWKNECEKEVQEKFDALDGWQELMEKIGKSEEEITASGQAFGRGRGILDENNYVIDRDILIQKCLDSKEWKAETLNK